MFRMGPCHSWWFGKAFPLGAAKMWRQRHPVLWWYFHLAQRLCGWFRARRDREWKVFGDDYADTLDAGSE